METIATHPPLQRTRDERIFAGVCAGVAGHLRIPVLWVRAGIVALTAFFGIGALIYAGLWLLMPAHDAPGAPLPREPGEGHESRETGKRGARPLNVDRSPGRSRYLLIAAVLVGAVIGISMIAGVSSGTVAWGIAGVVALVGASLSWDQISRLREDDAQVESRGRVWFGVGVGWIIATFALVAALARGRAVSDVVWAVFAGAVLLAATALILLPVGLQLWRDLGAERSARAREAERADIAAHLHDSVLQTLALIRSRSHDPAAVTALARSQERELRQWLYSEPVTAGGSMARSLTEIGASVEESWGVPVEVVTVGDAEPSNDGPSNDEPSGDAFQALLAATREALTNAARHGGTDVRLFAEFTSARVEVFVRDRGPGFDLSAIPDDRRGVRDSIQKRMHRYGGHADIHTSADGTEVHLTLAARPTNGSQNSAEEGRGEEE